MSADFDLRMVERIFPLEQRLDDLRVPPREKQAVVAWRNAVSDLQMLPALAGLWRGGGGAPGLATWSDASGGGRTLNGVNSPETDHENDGLVPFTSHTRANSEDLCYRADQAFNIRGNEAHVASGSRGLTWGGWYRLDSVANTMGLMSRWTVGAN